MRNCILLCSLLAACYGADIRSGFYRGQSIVFENVEGESIYHGDIVLGPTALLEAGAPVPGPRGFHPESLTQLPGRPLWPGGVIPYLIDPALPDSRRQSILQAIAHWNDRTPIHLLQRAAEANYVRFTTGTSTVACSSSIGMIGGQQLIQLPEGCGVGETIHEIGHAVGLWHEQERADRNRFTTVLYENIDKANAAQFDQVPTSARDSGTYDYNSIMHYGPYDFSRDGLLPSMETVPAGIPLGQRTALSAGDIASVQRLYGTAPTRTTVATVPSGLKLRIDGALVDDGSTFDWTPGSQHTVEAPFQGDTQTRYLFGTWSDGGAVTHTFTASSSTTLLVANMIRQYRVTTAVTPTGSGTITLDPPSPDGFYNDRANIRISAAPAKGYGFVRWTVTPSRSLNPKWINLRAPTAIAATFATGPITTITSNPIGRTVIVDGVNMSTPSSFAWSRGEQHSLDVDTSQPSFVHYRFTGWSDSAAQAHTITASGQNDTYTASFVPQYTVTTRLSTAQIPGRVTLNPSTPDGFYDEGTSVELTASTSAAYRFSNWTGDMRGQTNPASLTVDAQKLVYAGFGPVGGSGPIAVVNAASGSMDAIAPGQLVSIYGAAIGPASSLGLEVANGRVTTKLGGVEVLFDGQSAAITFAGPGQINAVVPYEVRGKFSTSVQVRSAGQTTAPVTAYVLDSEPAFFTQDGSGTGPASVVNQDGSVNSPASPAPRDSIITLYATGEGVTNPLPANGEVVSPQQLPKPVLPVSVRIGGQPAVIHYAGAAPYFVAGVLQINAQIPTGVQVGPKVPVLLVIGDHASPTGVTIAVQ